MKHRFILLNVLPLAPLAVLHAGRTPPEIPSFGRHRGENFQSLENPVAKTSNDWN